MKKFWQTSNTTGKIAAGLALLGALLFILWAVWLYEGDGISNTVAVGTGVFAVLLFVGGFFVAAANTSKKPKEL